MCNWNAASESSRSRNRLTARIQIMHVVTCERDLTRGPWFLVEPEPE